MGNEDVLAKVVASLEGREIIKSKAVRDAMLRVRREDFVPERMRKVAYEDVPLPIPGGGTISAQHMHAILLEEMNLRKGDKVLEVGSGSGILLAYMREMVGPGGEVYGVEVSPAAKKFAEENLARAGYLGKVVMVLGNGYEGLPNHAPFDGIVASAAVEEIPHAWVSQLREDGVIVAPVGKAGYQELWRLEKKGGRVAKRVVADVAFVPLVR